MATVTLDFSKPHVLRNDREYDAAVAEIDALLDRGRLAREEEDRLEFLTLLVEAYDEAHYPMGETSTPQSAVDFLLEQNGMTRADLATLMGGRSRVSDFFSGNRPHLSLGQIAKLRERFGVSADVLLPNAPQRLSRTKVLAALQNPPAPRELTAKPSGGGTTHARSLKGETFHDSRAKATATEKDAPRKDAPRARLQAAKSARASGHRRK